MKNPKKSLSSIKAIIFDAGGVLFNSNWTKIKQEIMKRYGFSIFVYTDYPKKIGQKYGNSLTTGKISFEEVIARIAKPHNLKQFVKDYKRAYLKNRPLKRQILNLIKKLTLTYKIFCLTNTNDIHFKANKNLGIFKHFNKVYASCNIGIKKPDRNAFKLVLKENNLSPDKTIFIDDNIENIKSANSLGINSILFKNYRKLKESLKNLRIET